MPASPAHQIRRLRSRIVRLKTELSDMRQIAEAFHEAFQREMLDKPTRCSDMLTQHVNVGA